MKGSFPARPSLTPIFSSSAAFWAACAIAYSTGNVRDEAISQVILGVFAFAAICALALIAHTRTRALGILMTAAALGVILGGAQAASIHASAEQLSGGRAQRIELEVLEDSVNYGFGETALVRGAFDGCEAATFTAKLGDCGALLVGQRVIAEARFEAVDFADDRFAWQDGACGSLKASVSERLEPSPPLSPLMRVRARAIEGIGASDEAHALLQALVCGYRRNVRSTEMYGQFQTCGLAHLVAVSGAHLVIVTGLIASLLKRLKVARRISIAVLIAMMGMYYVVAGMPVSALRATIMSALSLLSFFGGRRPSSLNAIGVGLFAIVVASPHESASASLALSVLSTMGIVLFGPLVQSWLSHSPIARATFACDALSLTIAASLMSQAYACALFDLLPIVSPLANVLSAPLFAPVCALGLIDGLAGAVFAVPPMPIDVSAAMSCELLRFIVASLAQLPAASVPVAVNAYAALAGTAVLALALWAWWPKPTLKPLAGAGTAMLAVMVALTLSADTSDRIVMLDVGQGDSILVTSRGRTLLIDTGNQDAKLLHELAVNRISHIDCVLITHADDDHCGSLDQLARSVDVSRVIVASGMTRCDSSSAVNLMRQAGATAHEVLEMSAQDRFSIGAFMVRAIWPHEFTEEGGNADSLCVLLEYDADEDAVTDFTALMTGDAEKEELEEMIGEGAVGDIDILKVGHHGSRNGMTSEQLDVLKPEIALISCGKNNRYGHPTQQILDMLQAHGTSTYRTDLDGEVTCRLSRDRVSVRCASGAL